MPRYAAFFNAADVSARVAATQTAKHLLTSFLRSVVGHGGLVLAYAGEKYPRSRFPTSDFPVRCTRLGGTAHYTKISNF